MIAYLLTALLSAAAAAAASAGTERPGTSAICVVHHPLDPLDRHELRSTVGIIESDSRFPTAGFFPTISLLEPSKSDVLAWRPRMAIARQALADVYDQDANELSEVVVDLCSRTVSSWTPVPGAQPPVYMTEWSAADSVVRADEDWQAAMRARGVEPDDVYVDIWAPGDVTGVPSPDGHRLLRALSFLKGGKPNPYVRPIEGVVVTIDMTDRRVIEVTDTGPRPIATEETGDARRRRAPLPPLTGPAPRRSAIRIEGRQVQWQGWHLRVDYSPRSGVVLHEIGYGRGDVTRPIIYRLSLSEIWVPYADPDPNWAWHAAFDVGEYDLGQYAVPLKVGIDVPRGARFLDEVVSYDTKADGLFSLPHATAIYERQTPATWSRVDPTTLERDARGGRELVVAAEYAIGNYDYGIDYIFGLDGAITVEARATGTVLSKGVAGDAEGSSHGTHVAPSIGTPDHQHFLSFRIDLDVDGTSNRVVEEDTMTDPESEANAFIVRRTPIRSETGLDPDPSANRSWRFESTDRTDAMGAPTAYRITPTDWTVPFSSESYVDLHGAAFTSHPLWVTAYDPGQLYAAGDHPIGLDHDSDGLAVYASPPESLDGTDLVVWYTLGLTHHPEVEEYPVLNSHRMSFRITPSGFFDRNPALDLPR